MKTVGWSVLIIFFLVLAMLLVTILSQTTLLQTRARQGIGSQVDNNELLK